MVDAKKPNLLWQKTSTAVDEDVMAFLAGQDVVLDRALFEFDIQASRAHAMGLARIGLLKAEEAQAIAEQLDALLAAWLAGEFVLDQRFEDGHSAIESWLSDALGELGQRIHAGRSRNDQVAVAIRLYLKSALSQLASVCGDIAAVCLARAESEAMVVMPGHTHLQQAMPSSLGLWWAGHAESFIDNVALALAIRDWLDTSPLGAASGFGVNIALDRAGVAKALGFDRWVINPQAAQNARGKVELRALDALSAATGDLRRLCWDLSLYASAEFGYVSIPAVFCTGSSIMPNKHNPDGVELLRSLHATVLGAKSELEAVLSLPSGYQRDLQDTKPPLIRAFDRPMAGLALVPKLLEGLSWHADAMEASVSAQMHATDVANEAVARGVSFREAYRMVAEDLAALDARSAKESLKARVSPGACGDLRLDQLGQRLAELRGQVLK